LESHKNKDSASLHFGLKNHAGSPTFGGFDGLTAVSQSNTSDKITTSTRETETETDTRTDRQTARQTSRQRLTVLKCEVHRLLLAL